MATQRSTEIKVGIVTFLGIIIFILGITLGRGYSVSVSQTTVKFRFPSSAGIEATAPVTVNGVRRGIVSSVENNNGAVLITATLDDVSDLKKDAFGRITMLEITGGKKIEILPGTSTEKLDPNTVIPGETGFDIGEMIALVGRVGGNAESVLRRVDTIASSLTAALADGKIMNDARQSADKLNSMLTTMNELVEHNKGSLQSSLDNVHDITTELRRAVQTNSPAIDSLMKKLDMAVTNANSTIRSVDKVTKNADSLISQVSGLITDIKTGKGLVNKLLYDENFSMRLDSTLNNVHQFLNKIDEHGINVNLRLGTRP